MTGRVVGVSVALTLVVALGLAVQGPACFITLTWWVMTFALGVLGYETGRRGDRLHQADRAQVVAALERAEAVLAALDDEPPPLPPAIPVEMRDPAFQFRQARLDEFDACIKAWETCRGQSYEYMKTLCRGASDAKCRRDELLAQPLIADRRFTLTTHCQHGHVGDHWLGRRTTDRVERQMIIQSHATYTTYVKRICRFERCAAIWLEKT